MHLQRIRRFIPILLLLIFIVLAIAYLSGLWDTETDQLIASGTVEAAEVYISSELSGRVLQVLVEQGDAVKAGDPVLRLDDSLLQLQRERAVAAIAAAENGLAVAQLGQQAAELELDMLRQALQLEQSGERLEPWMETAPPEFEQPTWYFSADEQFAVMLALADSTAERLETALADLQMALEAYGGDAVKRAEQALAIAREAHLAALQIRELAGLASDRWDLVEAADELVEQAEADLEAAQQQLLDLVGEQGLQDLQQARARLAVAQAEADAVQDQLVAMKTGDRSTRLELADLGLQRARYTTSQAAAVLDQARAELAVIDLQLARHVLTAPVDGVVSLQLVEPGELLSPGVPALLLARLDDLTLRVYVSEDRYGQISLGDQAEVTVDSFPDRAFRASVTYIADQAEFTPRNVQTEEGRRATVFAIELSVEDPQGELKPGMPADVNFDV